MRCTPTSPKRPRRSLEERRLSRHALNPEACISLEDLKRYREAWLQEGRYRPLSTRTMEKQKGITDKLFWWLEREAHGAVSALEIRGFLTYLQDGHNQPKGRWDNPDNHANRSPVKPATMDAYFSVLRALANWLRKQGYVEMDLMQGLARPVVREDHIQPFTEEQLDALLKACKATDFPRRNEAILWFLLDTGVRASELCTLRMRDLDLVGHSATVFGKGAKSRTVYFSPVTAKAMNAYLRTREGVKPESYAFEGKQGPSLTRNALLHLMWRLGDMAGLESVRCSPHTFRHTFAIWFLRRGGSTFTLQHLLGHTDLKMTRRYVLIAQADAEDQHRAYSPAEYLNLNKTTRTK